MEVKENEQDAGLHARQAFMKQRFTNRNAESQYKNPLSKQEEISISESEISERDLQDNLKNENSKDKAKFQSFQFENNSPHSLAFLSNCQIDLNMQENQHKSVDNKFKFRQANEEYYQNSQLAFQNSNYQLNREKQFFENSNIENSSEGKNKKNSINSSKPYLGKTQPNQGENANSIDSKTIQKQPEDAQINPIQNKTLKHMIHQNKVNNIKKKFINSLIISCPSVAFKHLTRKKDIAIVVIFQFSKNIQDDSICNYLDYIIFLKYIDIPQKLQELETKLQISQTKLNWIKLFKLECLVLLIAHVACCIFLRIGLTEMKQNSDSWITQFKYDNNTNQQNYIISLYYIIITMTTIGYGDISPFTMNEKVFMILVAIIATNICAYSYTQINEIVKYEEQKKQNYQQTMQGINNEMQKMGLNILLQHKVRKHFEFQLYKEEEKKQYSENLFDVLPKSLKEEVLQELTQEISNEIIVLKNMSTLCLKEVRNSIKQKVLFPEEIIVKHNQLDNYIYYIAQGSVTLSIPVQVLSNEKYHKTPYMNVKTLTKNTAFGYEGFLLDQASPYTIKSDGVGFLLLIQKEEFLSILKKYPRDYEMYMMLKDEAFLNKKTENITQSCMSCNDSSHQIGSCPYVNFQKKRWKKPIQEKIIRKTFIRQKKDRIKSNSYMNLIINQDCAKQFILTQQRDEEINELYNLLKSNKQSSQNEVDSSETTNSSSSESDMTEQLEEDSSSFNNFLNSQKLTTSMQNNLMQNQQKQKRNSFISKEQKGFLEQLQIKPKRESFEIKKANNAHDNTKNMHVVNSAQGIQSKQLYVIEEGEEDTIQQSINRSLDSYSKVKKITQDIILQRQNEEKQFDKNNSKPNDNSGSNNSILPPSFTDKTTQQNVDYQDINVAPVQIYSNTSILNDIPDKNKVNSAQFIEENNQFSKTSINVSASLQQARQSNNLTPQQKKNSLQQSPLKMDNSKKRSSQTSIKDLNKYSKPLIVEEQWDIEDDNIMKASCKKIVQVNKEQTFQDEMFNIYQKNAKKALRSERRVSSLINKELESPYKFSTSSNHLFDEFTSPVLFSPTKRKNKYTQSIIIQNLEQVENNPIVLHNQSSTSQSQFDSEGFIQQTPSNQQVNLQGNLSSTSPLLLQKRSSQKILSNQVKFSQNIQNQQPGNTTPHSSLPQNNTQIDQNFDIQMASKNRDQKTRQSFSQLIQNDQGKHQPQSISPRNSETKINAMNQSLSEYKQQTMQNLNYINSQARMQTHLMLSSGESHQYSSEYQIKFQEGLQDLDMLIVRKNLRMAYEKGFIKNDLVKVQDNEIDIDQMKNYNFYYPQKNAKVIVFKLRRFQQAAAQKKSKIVSKINIDSKKKVRKSKQSEQSSLSVRNLSTKPITTVNQLSRPSLKIS